jgi:glycosyltransferase involved in cell wall biosynthesis
MQVRREQGEETFMPSPRSITVVIPTFNRREFVVDAVKSVLLQGVDDLEIIVVDDGSTDDTVAVLRPYMDVIRYLYQDNRGVSAARNRGVKESRGEMLAFLDSDDVWLPGKLKAQISRVLSQDVLSFEKVEWFVDQEEDFGFLRQAGSVKWPRCDICGYVGDPVLDVAEGRYFHLGTLLCRKETFLQIGSFDERLSMGEDEDWFGRASLLKHFHYYAKPFLRRRFHATQTALESEGSLRSLIAVFGNMKNRTEGIHPKASKIATKRLAAKWSHLSNELANQGRSVEASTAARTAYTLDPSNMRRLIKVLSLSMQCSKAAR